MEELYHHKFLVTVIVFVTFLFYSTSPAQELELITNRFSQLRFEHITIADGLPENSVWSIFQDHLGYLWFGTQNGLVKYDGYSFVVYQPKLADSLSISAPWIRAIAEDHTNTLWIGTAKGLNSFDRATETFISYYYNSEDSTSISSDYVRSIYVDTARRIWIGTHGGLSLYNEEKKIFENFSIDANVDDKSRGSHQLPVYDILEDQKSGNLFIATELTGLWMFNVNEKIFTKAAIQIDTMKQYIPSWILSFHQNTNNMLWMATTNGLSRLDLQTRDFDFFQLIASKNYIPPNLFNSVFEDRNGLIWIGSGHSGLLIFDQKTEKFTVNKPNQNNPYSLNNQRVWSIYEDHSGNIWAGTWGGGLNKWSREKWKFNSLKHDEGNPNSLANNFVNSICEDKLGSIWIGTDGGLDKLDIDNSNLTHYLHEPQNSNSISSNLISCVIADRFKTGVLWIGTGGGGLNKFNTEENLVKRYQNESGNKYSLQNNSIVSLLMDHSGILWIGTTTGLAKFDKTQDIFISYQHNPNDPESLSENEVKVLYEDSSGNIWVGTNKGGLNKLVRKTGKFIRYVSLTDDKEYSSITSIMEDNSKNLWVGTYLSGLHLFNTETGKTVKSITPDNGLSTNGVTGILKDQSNNIWISTLNGLFRFNPISDSLKGFRVEDGLSGNQFTSRYALASTNGIMFFGGRNGITIFDPSRIHDDPVPPKVVLSNISLFNRPDEKLTFDGFISEMQQIELSYDQNDLQIDFVGIHFGEPQKNQYKYFLENFDDGWVDAGTQRKAIYSNLDAGEYIFRVKAANRDGVWNEQGTYINIIITPPFWATWWAYTLYGLFFFSLLYFLRRYEINRVQWKNQAKLEEVKLKEREETDKMKSRFFANISHEFRTPLTLILGPSENIITKSSEKETKSQAGLIKRNASRLLELINQLLDLSKLEAGKLKLEASLSNIVPFVKGVVMSFESLAERKNISLKVNAESDKIDLYFDREKIAKILTNLLSNSFKFTDEGGEIIVSVSQPTPFIPLPGGDLGVGPIKKVVTIKVRDTGIGISEDELPKLFDRFYQVDSSQTKEYAGTGIGLALTKELVELHKGSIRVKSEERKYTEFTIELPFGRGHLIDDEIVEMVEPSKDEIRIMEKDFISAKEIQEVEVTAEDKIIVLIVEDNTDVREYIKDSLGDAYILEEAVNGEEGVNKAKKLIPDLIVSDVMMPKMDGNELTRVLKNDEKTSHIPIILLTAKAEQESKLEGLQTGADAYLTKPFDTKELLVRINNLLNIRKKLQEKYSKGILISKSDRKKLSDLDEKFMSRVSEVIEHHLPEEEFSIEDFDREIGMGRVQIYRKVKAITGKSPSRYIRSIRLVKAKKMIEEKKGNISEIAYSVGFGSPAYFTKCFKEEFGRPPIDLTN